MPFAVAAVFSLLTGIGHAAGPPQATEVPPAPPLIPAWVARIWDPTTSPFIPIPEVGTDPNSGTTVGILPVFLSSEHDQITRIIAPDVNYNSDLGYGANFRVFDYPSTDSQWAIVAGAKQRVERGVDGLYTKGILRQTDWSLLSHVVYDRSATGRFFGIGNESQHADQTNYTNEQAYVETTLGRNFGPTFQVALNVRPRYIQIEKGTAESLPSTTVVFPQLNGLGNEHEFLTRVFVSYDTRDSSTVPTHGSQIVGFAGVTDKTFLSTVSYSRFGVDARHFQPISDRFILAAHVALQYMPVGNNVPFWALSSLGGDRSVLAERQPLRGFGSDRFIDRNSFSSTVELRSKIFDLDLFTTNLTFEMAPFIDAGRVFRNLDDNPVSRLHVAGGVGLRAVARPFIVGYVDIGYGSEGTAIFSGVNYPF
jgi:outer membrane translocation and assembly module TamA